MANIIYDAIVFGIGHIGGWEAKEMCEKGLKTLILERGRNVEHIQVYTDTNKDFWQLTHHSKTIEQDRINSPIQRRVFTWNEVAKKYFVHDLKNPYEQVRPFYWEVSYKKGYKACAI